MPKKINRTGERRQMNNGMWAEIVEYRKSTDINIKFENGIIRQNIEYHAFKVGQVGLGLSTSILNKTELMNCGLQATVIAEHKGGKVVVKFEDGTIRTNVTAGHFRDGKIAKNKRNDWTDNEIFILKEYVPIEGVKKLWIDYPIKP